MASMLGRRRRLMSCGSPQCRHCSEDGATRRFKRIEQREVDREIADEVAEPASRSAVASLPGVTNLTSWRLPGGGV